jgi:ketosteroid isomerase-like protein
MRSRSSQSLLGGLLVITAALAAVAPSKGQTTNNETSQKEIRALEQRYVSAMNAKDVAAIMACFVDSPSLLVFDVTPPREYRGAAAYRKDWEDFFAAFPGPAQFRITDLSIKAGPSVGFGHRIDHVSLSDKQGKQLHLILRVTHGYVKVNGHWLIAHEHVSVPVDLESGRAVLASNP